jgi:hypothetical protein
MKADRNQKVSFEWILKRMGPLNKELSDADFFLYELGACRSYRFILQFPPPVQIFGGLPQVAAASFGIILIPRA